MGKLNDTKLRAIRATGKAQKLTDGKGLYLYVSPSGGTSWRIDYTFKGKRKTYTVGQYPSISLATARKHHLELKEQLAQGIDPSSQKKAIKTAKRTKEVNAFEVVALEWFSNKKTTWSEVHSKRVLMHLSNDLIPMLGQKDISTISTPELLGVARKIEARGAYETAHRTIRIASHVFRYAIAIGRAERDPAQDLRGALVPVQKKNFATITDPKEIGLLLRNIDDYTGYLIVKFALQIAPFVFVRPSELRQAQWAEFDLEAKEWRIPAKRMKMRQMHIVPLAEQVIALVKELQHYTGHSTYLFPSPRTDTAPISDMTPLSALRRMGYEKEDMTIHGFRSMASTLLNEQGYNRDYIERQLAHGERNSARASYNHAEYLPERRAMMQEWADYLVRLKTL